MPVPQKETRVAVQYHPVKERCSGFHREKTCHEYGGGCVDFSGQQPLRLLTMTCGGCCEHSLQRKRINLLHLSHKPVQRDRSRIMVYLSTGSAKASHHGPPVPPGPFERVDQLPCLRIGVPRRRHQWCSLLVPETRNRLSHPTRRTL